MGVVGWMGLIDGPCSSGDFRGGAGRAGRAGRAVEPL